MPSEMSLESSEIALNVGKNEFSCVERVQCDAGSDEASKQRRETTHEVEILIKFLPEIPWRIQSNGPQKIRHAKPAFIQRQDWCVYQRKLKFA